MKIAHIASFRDVIYEKSLGRQLLIYLLAKKQREEGHDVTVLSAPGSYIDGCNMVSFRKPVVHTGDRLFVWLLLRKMEAEHFFNSYKYLDSTHDIIHSHIMEEGMTFSKVSNSPCILTQHGTVPKNIHHLAIMKLYSLLRNTKIVTVSKYQYLTHKNLFGNDIVDYVYNCLDFHKFPFQAKPEVNHELTLCFIGRCVPEKGVHLAIQVADILHSQNVDVQLNIFTVPYPGFHKYFLEIVKQTEKKQYIKLNVRKSTSEVIRRLRNSDATLFPILWEEPFGYVQVESMACGTPIVAFPRGSVPEIVTPGINGFYCSDIKQMALAALRCRDLNREQCRRYAEERYTIENTYKKYLNLYEKVIKGSA